MTELRFDKEIYVGEAIDEAVKRFDGFADFELSEDDAAWVVRVTARKPKLQKRIVGELQNFALGLTIKNREAR